MSFYPSCNPVKTISPLKNQTAKELLEELNAVEEDLARKKHKLLETKFSVLDEDPTDNEDQIVLDDRVNLEESEDALNISSEEEELSNSTDDIIILSPYPLGSSRLSELSDSDDDMELS